MTQQQLIKSEENGYCNLCDMWEYSIDDIFLTIEPNGLVNVSLFSDNNEKIWDSNGNYLKYEKIKKPLLIEFIRQSKEKKFDDKVKEAKEKLKDWIENTENTKKIKREK